MTTTSLPSSSLREYFWNRQGQPIRVVYETFGDKTPVLLLPAFSTVSTRGEMQPLAELLANQFQTVALDWPGFGESDRPPLNYQPSIYHQFLQYFVTNVFNTPVAVIAAGHAAGYAMQLAQKGVFSKIVLVAPTWRGPLPTMMGKPPETFSMVREAVRSPILGQFLYKLNTAPSFLRWMYRRHVYTDETKLTPDFIGQKWEITQKSGARFAPVAFVTGGLDPFLNQSDFLAQFQPLPAPTMVIIAEQAPPKSKGEMEALAALPGVQTHRISGSLGLHEEHADAVAEAVLPFLTL
ncbi:alpha/beta fold hydrolase [Microseira sp. BLCC-F43]|uniref:alpha/beta fold hydrolase n=1 Tax=Microseira sp. BLCC-F43 TaxID=3153602 RepID=UPI0035BAF3AF